ncbi:MAG TPA: hypothetical protein VFQ45_15525, partial [Longimicrobium sp.]|nr:hypothetical protein [Longimicrobium sp.]
MPDTITTPDVFSRDQVEMLSARKGEADWLREARMAAHGVFAATPMPTTKLEDWRYTDPTRWVRLEGLSFAEERGAAALDALPQGLRTLMAEASQASARLVQVDASVVLRELPDELAAQGVVFSSLESAARERPELVQKYLGTAVTPDDGKFAAMNAAMWSGGAFLYVPRDVRVEVPLRVYRWLTDEESAVFGRLLVVAEQGAHVAVVDEMGSADLEAPALSVAAAEIFAEESATVVYTSVQRYGRGVAHLS